MTTTTKPPEAVTMADFKAWLGKQIATTSDAVSVTRGTAQGEQIERLLTLIEASKVIGLFEQEARK